MELKEAFEKNLPLKIVFPPDEDGYTMQRVIAEGFVVGGGVVFWDVGWYEASSHPNHFVEGRITGTGPWKVGDKVIEEMKEDDDYWGGWALWKKFQASPDGKDATRKLVKSFTEEDYKLI